MSEKVRAAIIGPGNIGTDLLAKLQRSDAIEVQYVVGVVEIAAGILVLARPRIGSIVVAAWLAGIALNLVAGGRYLDVAVRDLVMAVTALCLARLSSVRAQVGAPERSGAKVRPVGAPGATIPARA